MEVTSKGILTLSLIINVGTKISSIRYFHVTSLQKSEILFTFTTAMKLR